MSTTRIINNPNKNVIDIIKKEIIAKKERASKILQTIDKTTLHTLRGRKKSA